MYGNDEIGDFLRKIKESGGYPGEISDSLFPKIVPVHATVEISPYTGLRLQWHLTKKGKETLRWSNYRLRHKDRLKKDADERRKRYERNEVSVARPLTIEVLDALKSILHNGNPGTDKMHILARIQRAGTGGYYQGQYYADGPWAKCEDGVTPLPAS